MRVRVKQAATGSAWLVVSGFSDHTIARCTAPTYARRIAVALNFVHQVIAASPLTYADLEGALGDDREFRALVGRAAGRVGQRRLREMEEERK